MTTSNAKFLIDMVSESNLSQTLHAALRVERSALRLVCPRSLVDACRCPKLLLVCRHTIFAVLPSLRCIVLDDVRNATSVHDESLTMSPRSPVLAVAGICVLIVCGPAAVQAKRQLLTPGTCSCTTILPPGPVCDVFCGKAFPVPGHHGHGSGCSCQATCNSEMYECTKHGPNSGCSCFCEGGQPQIMGGGECHRLY